MTLLALTALLAALITVSIAISIFVRTHRSRVQILFGFLNANLAICLCFIFLFSLNNQIVRDWSSLFLVLTALGLPITGLRFFSLFLSNFEKTLSRLLRFCYPLSLIFAGLTVTPLYSHSFFALLLIGYIAGSFFLLFLLMIWRYQHSHSGGERSRLRSVIYGGVATLMLIMLDLISFLRDWPYVFLGSLLLAVYMYYMLQIVLKARTLDMSEILGRGVVLGILSFFIAGLYWLMTFWADTSRLGNFFATVLVASIIILILYEPLKNEVEVRAADSFFRQRRELRLLLEQLRRDLIHVIDLDKSVRLLIERLRRSKRVTHASFYLLREDASGYERVQSFCIGELPIPLLEIGRHASFLQHFRDSLSPIIKQEIEFRYASALFDWKKEGEVIHEEERLIDILRTLEDLYADVCFPCVSSDSALLGFICIKDDRFENAYNSEELSYMMMVAAQLAIIVENSRLFEAVKERERLAVLGAMAAGLAHEIRNPLGAIKGAAQLLNPDAHDENEREFIGIILEEVDRLNGVVSQFLDYARPMRNGLMLIDINQVLRRTVQLLDAEKLMSQVVIHENLQPDLPLIYADAEQLKQVFINLLHNSAEAMSEGGSIFVQSELIGDIDNPMVEISFADEGAGIPPEVLKNIFIPFFTTKERGTGMGLSICQRIIEHHDGSIQVQNRPTKGTVIIIRLPVQRPPNNKNMR